MNDQEKTFLQSLQAIVRSAKKNRGTVSQDQLDKAFEGMELTNDQLQMIKDYLTTNNIGIDEPLEADALMSDEDHNYLEDYESMVAAIEQPSDGEMDAIKLNAMAGEKDAQQRLAELLLPKVIDIAKLYAGQGVYMEDLIGTGNEALMRAVALLAPLEGPEEVEGAIGERIMNAMEDLVAENIDEKAKGSDAAAKANRVMEAADALADALGRKVTVEELAAEGDVTMEEIMEAVRLSGNKIENLSVPEQ